MKEDELYRLRTSSGADSELMRENQRLQNLLS